MTCGSSMPAMILGLAAPSPQSSVRLGSEQARRTSARDHRETYLMRAATTGIVI